MMNRKVEKNIEIKNDTQKNNEAEYKIIESNLTEVTTTNGTFLVKIGEKYERKSM